MKEYGLIGFPLSHSFSGKYFTGKFQRDGIVDCTYELFPIQHINLLPQLIAAHHHLIGLNVTIPFKEQIISLLDEVEESIPQIGAVNTVKIYRNKQKVRLKGFNTDVYGFSQSLQPLLKSFHTHALILGTGGAAKAVAYVLKNYGIQFTWVSRTPRNVDQISYEQLSPELVANSKLIINTSPVGMYPEIHECPLIPYDFLTREHILYDLIYNPQETRFMTQGKNKGATVLNGLQMLYKQADRAWEIWNSEE
jgi:shikimate dehydrogenase